jgi:hypothetical protein
MAKNLKKREAVKRKVPLLLADVVNCWTTCLTLTGMGRCVIESSASTGARRWQQASEEWLNQILSKGPALIFFPFLRSSRRSSGAIFVRAVRFVSGCLCCSRFASLIPEPLQPQVRINFLV